MVGVRLPFVELPDGPIFTCQGWSGRERKSQMSTDFSTLPATDGSAGSTEETVMALLADHPEIKQQLKLAWSQDPDSFDPSPLALTLLLYRVMSRLESAFSIEHAPIGLNGSEFNVLTVLARAESGLSMGDLAKAVSVRPPNLTRVVTGLDDLGLIERFRNSVDRRSNLVRLSASGEQLLANFLPGHWRFVQTIFSALDRGEQKQLVALLGKLLGSLCSAEGDGGGMPPALKAAAHHAWDDSSDQVTYRARRGKLPSQRYVT